MSAVRIRPTMAGSPAMKAKMSDSASILNLESELLLGLLARYCPDRAGLASRQQYGTQGHDDQRPAQPTISFTHQTQPVDRARHAPTKPRGSAVEPIQVHDLPHQRETDELFMEQQGEGLVGENVPDNLAMETWDVMKGTIRGFPVNYGLFSLAGGVSGAF